MNRWVGKNGGWDLNNTFCRMLGGRHVNLSLYCSEQALTFCVGNVSYSYCCAARLVCSTRVPLLSECHWSSSGTRTQTHTDKVTSFITAMSCTEDEPQDHRHMLTNTNTHWVHTGSKHMWRQGHGTRLFLLHCGQNAGHMQQQSKERLITDEFFHLSVASLSKMVRKWRRKA